VFSRGVWSKHLDPEQVQMCIDEIKSGNLSTNSAKARPEQEECENMLSHMHDGKNPIGDFEGRIRGKDAIEFAEQRLKDDKTNKETRKQ
jgi:hypothetical protein